MANLYEYLVFQERYKLLADQNVWRRIKRSGWFPFLCLYQVNLEAAPASPRRAKLAGSPHLAGPDGPFSHLWVVRFADHGSSEDLTQRMIGAAAAEWDLDELLPSIAAEAHERHAPMIAKLVETHKWFAAHREHLSMGLRHFDEKDYLSANAILYPRVEGLLRTYYFANAEGPRLKPTDHILADTVASAHKPNALLRPPLAPKKFSEFLKSTFFRDFKGGEPSFVSRHTLAHGVAPSDFAANQKAAVLAVLALHQLTFILR